MAGVFQGGEQGIAACVVCVLESGLHLYLYLQHFHLKPYFWVYGSARLKGTNLRQLLSRKLSQNYLQLRLSHIRSQSIIHTNI